MPSAFDADFEAADELFAEVFGMEVSIQREGQAATTATAEVFVREFQEGDEPQGNPEVIQSRDYVIAVAQYKVAGVAVVPLAGDRITESIQGETRTFEVMAIAGRSPAEFANLSETLWLIHTKRVA